MSYKNLLRIKKNYVTAQAVVILLMMFFSSRGSATTDSSGNGIRPSADEVIQFGVHYEYPFGGMSRRHEWLPKGEDDWRRDIAKIKETGFNSIRIRIGFDSKLDDVAKLLDIIHEQGLTVVFGFATFYVNDDFVEKYKDSKIIGGDGEAVPVSKNDLRWQRACIDHPFYRSERNNLIRNCVSRFGKHPAVIVWDIHNEPSIGPVDNGCFCIYTLAKYRAAIKNEFGTIQRFNKTFNKNFRSFDAVRPPAHRTPQDEEFYIHWRSFIAADLNNFLTEGRDIVAAQIPDAMITHNVTHFDGLPAKGQDWWLFKDGYKLLSMSRYTGTDEHSVAGTLGYEVLKAISPDKVHWIEEFQGGPFPVPQLNVLYSGKEAEIELNGALSHGIKGIYFYRWDPLLSGAEPQVNGMVEPDSYETDRRLGIQKAIARLQPYLSFIKKATYLKPSVGIYFTRNQVMRAHKESAAPEGVSDAGVADFEAGAYQLLSDIGYEAGCIVHGTGGLKDYKAVVFPYVSDLSDEEIADIEKYVSQGGSAIIDLPPLDQKTVSRFSRIFGIQTGKGEWLQYFPGFNVAGWTVRSAGDGLNLPKNDFAGYCFNERIALKGDGTALNFDDNGEPAALIPGKYNGRLLITGCRLFYSYHISMHPRTRQIVHSFLENIVQPDIIIQGGDEEFRPYLEARALEDTTEGKALLFLMNRSPEKSYSLRVSVKGYRPVSVDAPAYDITRVVLTKKED